LAWWTTDDTNCIVRAFPCHSHSYSRNNFIKPVIVPLILATDMWICDWHHICVFGHDWVGIGDKPWPEASNPKHHEKAAAARKPCKLGDKNWKNDCR
jgi:hypothetical protein